MNIKEMTLEQKIGQMIMAGFPSDKLDKHAIELIEGYNIGNIILFARNIKDKEGLASLNRDIQKRMIKKTGIPAFISIDQEGGMVTRIYKGAAFLPGNMAFAAAGVHDATLKEGQISGEELRALGININLAPVVDVNNNSRNPVIGVRSYGDKPEKVAKMAGKYIEGLQSRGVIATAKHFPGHGDTSMDSHLDLPSVPHGMDRLLEVELYPFREAIRYGVDAIMTAHILFPAIEDEKLPATLSYKVITGLLRNTMDFKGLVMTDCMEMKAIASYFGTVKAAVMAVKAGADLVCLSHSLDLQIGGFTALKEAVEKGEIPESRINESVSRILKMKEKYKLFENPYPDGNKVESVVGCLEHRTFAEAISQKSITVIKDKNNLLPVRPGKIVSISTEPVILTGADDTIIKESTFCEAVKERLGGEAHTIPLNPDDAIIKRVSEGCRDADTVIIGTYNANLNKGQMMMVNEICKFCENVIVISLRNPYDVTEFDNVSTCICAYEYTPVSIKSVLNVLTGRKKTVGKLPVDMEVK